MPNPIDIPCLEDLHAEATRFYANGRIELTHDDETARRWAVVIFEAFPALIRELNELRAERDRLRAERDAMQMDVDAVERTLETAELPTHNGDGEAVFWPERVELLMEQLAAAHAAVAGLREALAHQEAALCIIRDRQLGQVSVKDIDQGIGQIRAALARTSDQHRARIEAGVLREAAVRLRKQDCSDEAVRTYEWLTDEAERLERGE